MYTQNSVLDNIGVHLPEKITNVTDYIEGAIMMGYAGQTIIKPIKDYAGNE